MATKSKPVEVESAPRGYTYAEAGEVMGLSARQVKRLCDDGLIGYIRHRNGRRLLPRHIADYYQRNEVQPVA